jgi:hypothetical protein
MIPPSTGTTISSPNGRFAFNRGYVKALAVRAGGWPVTVDVTTVSIAVGSPLIYTNYIQFEPNFWAWSSNTYTLDWVVAACWYVVPGGTPAPATWGVNWFANVPPPYPVALDLDPIATDLPYTWVDLPPAPPGYWAG